MSPTCPGLVSHDLVAFANRGNGDVEIWNADSDWHMERVLPGGAATSVEALVWDRGRLFAGGEP